MEVSNICGKNLYYEERVAMAQNMMNEVGGRLNVPMSLKWLEGLAGWDNKQIPDSRRMGLQNWWTAEEGQAARAAQCVKNRAGPKSAEAPWCNTNKCEACVARAAQG